MWSMLYPILIILFSNILYNICTKSAPSEINAFAMLTVTYLIAAAVSFATFFITSRGKNIIAEFGKNPQDTGSPEVQIALLTERIRELTDSQQGASSSLPQFRFYYPTIVKKKQIGMNGYQSQIPSPELKSQDRLSRQGASHPLHRRW